MTSGRLQGPCVSKTPEQVFEL